MMCLNRAIHREESRRQVVLPFRVDTDPMERLLTATFKGDPEFEGFEPQVGVEEQRVWVIINFTSPATQWQQLGDSYRRGQLHPVGRQQRPASSGQRNGLSTQILAGINEGDRIIAHHGDRVRNGVRVVQQ